MKDISIKQNNAEAAETQRTQSLTIWAFSLRILRYLSSYLITQIRGTTFRCFFSNHVLELRNSYLD